LLFLLLVLLNASPFGFIQQKKEDGKSEFVIHSPQSLAELNVTFQKLQIKYGFDVIHISVVPTFNKIISEDYIPGISFNPLSANLLTYPSRGPPRLITIL
jgi:hypothetical protein